MPIKAYKRYLIEPLFYLSFISLVLFMVRVVATETFRFGFVPWNLVLAWVPFLLTLALLYNLRQQRWMHWSNLALSLLWLFFLPNTWYVLTDFIHVGPTGEISQLYDVVLVSTLVFAGFGLGFASLFLIYFELKRRFGEKAAFIAGEVVLLLSSFAIYLGRELRWNSWDVVTNPSGLIFDVSDQIIDPLGHPRSFSITVLFFLLLSILFMVLLRALRAVRSWRSQ